jgi:uroporphyrinogen-III decarboxylase
LSRPEDNKVYFIPLIFRFAARVEQTDVSTFWSQPGELARSLKNAQNLFQYEVLINHFNLALEAEAAGSRVNRDSSGELISVKGSWENIKADSGSADRVLENGAIQAILEATKRLRLELPRIFLMGVVSGPVRLCSYLIGYDFWLDLATSHARALDAIDFAGEIILEMVRSYCEQGVNGILLVETLSVPNGVERNEDEEPILETARDVVLPLIKEAILPVYNITEYYHSKLVFFLQEGSNANRLSSLFDLPVESVIFGEAVSLDQVKAAAVENQKGFGISIPLEILNMPKEKMRESISNIVGTVSHSSGYGGNYLITEWEVPPNTPVQELRDMMTCLKGHR